MALAEGGRARWLVPGMQKQTMRDAGSSPSLVFLLDMSWIWERGGEVPVSRTWRVRCCGRGIKKAGAAGYAVETETQPGGRLTATMRCTAGRGGGTRLPPQPFQFFANIQKRLLQPGLGFIVTAAGKQAGLRRRFFCIKAAGDV